MYEKGKEEVLRDLAFSILIAHTDTVEKLEDLAFSGRQGLAAWSTKELIEITNRFRLLSSPENEIRLYRECRDETFLSAPRVREFYVLALNKIGCPMEAIQEALRMIAAGENSALIWAALGESYSARAFFAEALIESLGAKKESSTPIGSADSALLERFANYFPEAASPATTTIAQLREMRRKNLRMAARIFRRGFRDSGSSFPGLGWIQRAIDGLMDLMVERKHLEQKKIGQTLDYTGEQRLLLIGDDVKTAEKRLDDKVALVGIMLELQGGMESLDYWTRAGIVLLAVIRSAPLSEIRALMPGLFAAADANFKITTTLAELKRIKNNYFVMVEHAVERHTPELEARIDAAEYAIGACHEALARFEQDGRNERSKARDLYRASVESNTVGLSLQIFLAKTVNFRTLTASLVPLNISGNLGRVGSRVPDLQINRQVQEDLKDLVENEILQILAPKDREFPPAVVARIQQVIGAGLKIGELQDLQSSTHAAFDIRSDGLIALSGIDRDMRKNTHTGTDLTAALLMQTGDCRETMYLNGAFFACWQQLQVKKRVASAMLCLELNYTEGFESIVHTAIPQLMRYQVRGGQTAVYVESIAMKDKYHCEQSEQTSGNHPLAAFRPYGVDELRRKEPLTQYELENAKIKITFTDGSVLWVEPKDPDTGKWRPMAHTPIPGGGVPLIPNAGDDYENIQSLQLLNLVEEHALTFLYDSHEQTVRLSDGFYNQNLYSNSPYAFAGGMVNLDDLCKNNGLLRAGSRLLKHADGSAQEHPVYLEFLPFSQTDYEGALVEGDIPGTIQLMGKIFKGDLRRERKRIKEGISPLPALLERVHKWECARREAPVLDKTTTERKLARLILDLARNHPELIHLQEVHTEQPIITEETKNDSVFLVLSGQFNVVRNGKPLCNDNGEPIVVNAGGILGELSALRGGAATATVVGKGVVFGIRTSVIRQHLADNEAFRDCMEELAQYRVV